MIEPNYLPFILIGGGIIFVVLFFHYVPFFLWLSAKVSGVYFQLQSAWQGVPRHDAGIARISSGRTSTG